MFRFVICVYFIIGTFICNDLKAEASLRQGLETTFKVFGFAKIFDNKFTVTVGKRIYSVPKKIFLDLNPQFGTINRSLNVQQLFVLPMEMPLEIQIAQTEASK